MSYEAYSPGAIFTSEEKQKLYDNCTDAWQPASRIATAAGIATNRASRALLQMAGQDRIEKQLARIPGRTSALRYAYRAKHAKGEERAA